MCSLKFRKIYWKTPLTVSFTLKLQKNFIEKETLAEVISCEFCKIFKNTFFTEHLRWLLLAIYPIL